MYGEDWVTPTPQRPTTSKEPKGADGHQVRDAVFWEAEREQQLHYPLESLRLANHRNKTHPMLGQVHDA